SHDLNAALSRLQTKDQRWCESPSSMKVKANSPKPKPCTVERRPPRQIYVRQLTTWVRFSWRLVEMMKPNSICANVSQPTASLLRLIATCRLSSSAEVILEKPRTSCGKDMNSPSKIPTGNIHRNNGWPTPKGLPV